MVSMPYWEWNEVCALSQLAEEYLASRLGGLADWRTVGKGVGEGVG